MENNETQANRAGYRNSNFGDSTRLACNKLFLNIS